MAGGVFFCVSDGILFANSSKVEFFKDGTWKEVDCKYSTVPEAVIPEAILRYVKATYPDHKVVKIEKEDRGYEAKLANGMKLEDAMTKWQTLDQLPAEYRG